MSTTTGSTFIKLKQPDVLPASGLKLAVFKPWRNQVISFLKQDTANFHFLKGTGKYNNWTALSDSGVRITRLHNEDIDLITINDEKTAGTKTPAQARADLAALKLLREQQLERFLAHIASFCHYTEQDDIMSESTSLEWIWEYLESHYDIQSKGSHFLKIADITYSSEVLPQVFYKQLRSAFQQNLRPSGDVIKYQNNRVLETNEELSPSFENVIIMLALKEIDPRLPRKVRKEFEHRLSEKNISLMDIQPSIFQAIPTMLEELNKDGPDTRALTVSEEHGDQVSLQAYSGYSTGGHRGQGKRGRGGRGARGGPWRGGRYQSAPQIRQGARPVKFCQACKLAGKHERLYTSHDYNNCNLAASLRSLDLDPMEEQEEEELLADEEDLVNED